MIHFFALVAEAARQAALAGDRLADARAGGRRHAAGAARHFLCSEELWDVAAVLEALHLGALWRFGDHLRRDQPME